MGSPFLYFADDRLSLAELSAACLDGDLVGLGEAYIPADAVETRALRAGSLRELLGEQLAATHLSAAWVHGALVNPPSRHTVQRAVSHRLHRVPDRRVVYRDLSVDPADLLLIGGVRVTSAARTLVDLARIGDDVHVGAARLLAQAHVGLIDDATAWLQRRHRLPYKQTALDLLRSFAADRPQEEVTRYTS